jgi:hypothetical protein
MDRTVKVEGPQYLVEAQISSVDSDYIRTIEAWTVKGLASKCGIVDWSVDKQKFPHLQRCSFAPLPPNPKIDILFGTNTTFVFATDKMYMNKDNPTDPIAMRTPLGWTCVGSSAVSKDRSTPITHTNCFTNVLFKPRNIREAEEQ